MVSPAEPASQPTKIGQGAVDVRAFRAHLISLDRSLTSAPAQPAVVKDRAPRTTRSQLADHDHPFLWSVHGRRDDRRMIMHESQAG